MAVPRRGIRVPQAVSRIRPRLAGDDRLVALVRSGDLTAFEALYDRHVRELLSFCNCILGSRHDAEDAVQSTFASAYRALLADERPIDVRPWLFAIARNAALSIVRSRRPTSEYDDSVPGGSDPVAQAEQRESMREVVATMRELPERQRTALALAELSGLSQQEIGAVLGVAPEKVKSYIFQARSNLISERVARSADCREIREELAGARGAALLKGRLRRHLRSCEPCSEYARELSRRRGQLAALLPVVPTLALKRRVLGAASGNASGAGVSLGGAGAATTLVGTSAELAGTGVKTLVAKLLIGAVGIGAGTGAGTAVLAASTPAHRPATDKRSAVAGVPHSGAAAAGTSAALPRANAGDGSSASAAGPERRSRGDAGARGPSAAAAACGVGTASRPQRKRTAGAPKRTETAPRRTARALRRARAAKRTARAKKPMARAAKRTGKAARPTPTGRRTATANSLTARPSGTATSPARATAALPMAQARP